MSSLGDWLDAMVRLRAQRLQEAEYKQSNINSGLASLGEGIGGFLQGVGKNQQSAQNDAIANQLMNQQIPRAQAVDASLQGPADAAASQMAPFHAGGMTEFALRQQQDKQALAQEKAANAMALGTQRNEISSYGADLASQRLAMVSDMNDWKKQQDQEKMALRQQRELDQQALAAYKQSDEKWKKDYSNVTSYNQGMRAAYSAAAGAKTDEEYQKAITVIQSLFQTGKKQGFDVAEPQVPISPLQRAAAEQAQREMDLLKAKAGRGVLSHMPWDPNPSPDQISASEKALQELPG